jgi:hypothetical protein
MGWEVIAGLVLTHGIPFAERLIDKWSKKIPVTPEEFAELKALASQSAYDVALKRLQAAGIDPASEQGKILLGLTVGP